jgi:hypothetical protein
MPSCRDPGFQMRSESHSDPYTKANADVLDLFEMYDSEGGISGLYASVTGTNTRRIVAQREQMRPLVA